MKKSAWIISAALLLLWLPQQVPADQSTSNKINWSTYADASSHNDGNRKYFIYFYSDQCGFCERMEKKTFTDQAIINYLNANYTPVKVNAGKEFKLAARFGIQGVPDLRFMSPKGEGIARWPGYIESKRLLTLLQYIHTDSYESISYADFVKRQKRQ